MGKTYIFCRFWSGFTTQFPYERFNDLDKDQLKNELWAAADAEGPSEEAINESLTDRSRRLLDCSVVRDAPRVRPAAPSERKLTPQMQQWAVDRTARRTPNGSKDRRSDVLLVRKLQWMGWLTGPICWSWAFAKQHIVAVAPTEAVATTVAQALGSKYRDNITGPHFGVIVAESVSQAQQLLFDQEAAQNQMSATVRDNATSLAELTRCVIDLLERACLPADQGGDDDKDYAPALQILNRYTKALQIIYDTGRKMESQPSTYAGQGETAIRDLLITTLGSHFQNVCGERFNKAGKTDIFIEEQGESVLIAECKIWSGPKSYLDAIDQLLGYIRWRDARAAVILFANTKEIGPVLKHIKSATSTHHAFVKAEASDRPGWYCFELRQNNDPVQSVRLAVLCFHFPQGQDADVSR